MRRIWAAAALVLMVVGPPFALVAWGFRDWAELTVFTPADVRVLLAALTIVGWAAWAVWVLALVLEVVAVVSAGRWRVRLPGLTAPQALAGLLVSAVLASGPTAGASAAPREVAAMPAAPAVAATKAPDAVEPRTQADAPETTDGRTLTHVVAVGDDLWSLAEAYYDDGRAWRRIVDANPRLADDPLAELPVGESLVIREPVIKVTVRAGDTLSGLALTHLGDADRWPEIAALNPQRIADPDVIDVGWVLQVPRAVPVAKPLVKVESRPGRDQTSPSTPGEPSPHPRAGDTAPATPVSRPVEGLAPHAEAVAPPAESTALVAPTLAPAEVDSPDLALAAATLGGLSSVTAGAALLGIGVRRSLRDRTRPVGRRFAQPGDDLLPVESALAVTVVPDRELLLDRALRHLGATWADAGASIPRLGHAAVTPTHLEFVFPDAPTEAPEGFQQVGDTWAVTWQTLAASADPDAPAAYPALVTLGQDADGNLVMIDLLGAGVLGVASDGNAVGAEVLSALLVELACAPWASEVELTVITDDPAFVEAAAEGVHTTADADAALAHVEAAASERATDPSTYATAHLDADRTEAWQPRVLVSERTLNPEQLATLESAIHQGERGLAALLPVSSDATSTTWHVTATGRPTGPFTTGHLTTSRPSTLPANLTPQSLPAHARAGLTGLYAHASSPHTDPAPWWAADDQSKVIPMPTTTVPSGPYLMMLGPVELRNTTGDEPTRSVRQCMEYCAYLLEHPGVTATQMGASLLVAEGTRRSNMSRLRAWLGRDAAGQPYLPDAYSGHIHLHEAVTSDWEYLQQLLAAGVNRTPPARLRQALELVRGAPLADAAPGQWHWAEMMRSDMTAVIRDAAMVLARHARQHREIELGRWALNQGQLAAPDDEILLTERIRLEQSAGNLTEVKRLVDRVTRTARVLGIDLLPDTVMACQEALEGRIRARRA